MFNKSDLDADGNLQAPFNLEFFNFNPHLVRGHFKYDSNGRPIIEKDGKGNFIDLRGSKVTSRGYRIDPKGHLIDNKGRKKLDKSQLMPDGDLPKLLNYEGRHFDITNVIGQIEKNKYGDLLIKTDDQGNWVDENQDLVNSKGYLVDDQGNVIDNEYRVIFEKRHLENDEIPKLFPFT